MTDSNQQTININVGCEPDADWYEIQRTLETMGAKEVEPPSPENPDLFKVRLPVDEDSEAFIEQAQALPGVRYAERDAWFTTF